MQLCVKRFSTVLFAHMLIQLFLPEIYLNERR